MPRVIFYISNSLSKLLIRVLGFMLRYVCRVRAWARMRKKIIEVKD